jgi:hypothetical protein
MTKVLKQINMMDKKRVGLMDTGSNIFSQKRDDIRMRNFLQGFPLGFIDVFKQLPAELQ